MILDPDTTAGRPWPRNAWYQAAWSHEMEGAPLARTLLNEPVVLYRDAAGRAHALEDRCCHRGAPLRLGQVVADGLQCGYHGLVFDGTGACVKIPGADKIPADARVKAYPVVERQDFVWLWMGDPDAADESLVLDYPWHDDHDAWSHRFGLNHIHCNYILLVDNLMDLTHIPHVHLRTIGGGDQSGQVAATMEVTPTDTGVHYIRWMEGIQPPPTYVKGAGFADGTKVDRWQEFEYVVPAAVLQWSGALETGRGARDNRDQKGGFSLRGYHGGTPETERTCHYFWSISNGYKPGDEAATDELYADVKATFAEDIVVLEAQQKALEEMADRPLVNIRHDTALVAARRAIERRIGQESVDASGATLAAE